MKNVYDKFLHEMAYERKEIRQECHNLHRQILIHFVKIAVFNNPEDLKGHIRSINSWLYAIQDMTLNGKKRLKPEDYFTMLFSKPVDDEEVLISISNRHLHDYTNRKDIDFIELYNLLKSLYQKFCEDISQNKFITILDYSEMNKIIQNIQRS